MKVYRPYSQFAVECDNGSCLMRWLIYSLLHQKLKLIIHQSMCCFSLFPHQSVELYLKTNRILLVVSHQKKYVKVTGARKVGQGH